MTNQEIAKILYEISQYLEMEDVAFKPRAYEKAGINIGGLEEEITDIYKKEGKKGLLKIPAVGKGIADVIEELIKINKSRVYEKLKKKTPVNLSELTAIEGVGPKTVMRFYKNLKIKNLKDLKRAAKAGEIRQLKDFGLKSEENILQGIEFLNQGEGRFLLGFVLREVRKIEQRIREFPGVKKAIVAGSIRRMKETIGDGDLLVTVLSPGAAKRVSEFFVNMPEVARIYAYGSTKSSVRLKNNMDFDLRVVPEQSFGAALQYFTGSKDHNIALRKIAIRKGYKLNEYGLFDLKSKFQNPNCSKSNPKSKCQTEEKIYEKLGLQWIPPEIRENTGEIESAQQNKLPKLIGYNGLKGDLQIHTTWSDGANSIGEMIKAAMRMGLEYVLITDHTKSLLVAEGLEEKEIVKQGKEIDKINQNVGSPTSNIFRVLKGLEVDILKDGRLDIKDEVLKKLDIVGISIHSNFKMSKKQMTERIIRAMKNPNADILFHPTGRLINKRPGYELDIEKIIRAAKETKTILEINAHINRLDLKDEYARMAKEAGVKLSIGSDAHSIHHFQYLELGIAQARRAWLEKKDIINAWPVEKLLKFLK